MKLSSEKFALGLAAGFGGPTYRKFVHYRFADVRKLLFIIKYTCYIIYYTLYSLHINWDDLCGSPDREMPSLWISEKGCKIAEKLFQGFGYGLRIQTVKQCILILNRLVVLVGNRLHFGGKSFPALVKLHPAPDSLSFH